MWGRLPACRVGTRRKLAFGWAWRVGSIDNDPDSQYNQVSLTITGVTQDEPVNGLGDGDTSPDAVISDCASLVLLRAERAGGENGRVYAVSFTATDGCESCTGAVFVSVPDSRNGAAVDDGQAFDSTQP